MTKNLLRVWVVLNQTRGTCHGVTTNDTEARRWMAELDAQGHRTIRYVSLVNIDGSPDAWKPDHSDTEQVGA